MKYSLPPVFDCLMLFKAKRILIPLLLPFLYACSSSGEGVNPGLVDLPLVYAKRTIPVEDDGITPRQYDVRDPLLFSAGGDLYLRDYASASSPPRNITQSITGGTGDVKDIEVSYDGDKVIFSLRLDDPNPNDDDVPKWGIYEYNIETDVLRRLIALDSIADDGNDVAPFYLPDGRIVFSSDRQRQSREVLLFEDGPDGPKAGFSAVDERRNGGIKALVLHVMDSDGDNIHQISFNQSHDLDPVVLPNGRILFSRWEKAGNNNMINLYTMNPDGSDVEIYYGGDLRSHQFGDGDTKQFTQPRVMPDGRILVLARPFTNTFAGGDLLMIDGANYVDINQPTYANQGVLSGPAQVKATVTNVSYAAFARSGRYGAAFPLQDGSNRLIVSKGNCQLTIDDITDPDVVVQLRPCAEPYLSNPAATEMPYSFGLWIYDLNNDTERPLIAAEPGYILTDVAVAQPQELPAIIYDREFSGADADLALENVGLLHIRSVYDFGNATFNCRFLNVYCSPSNISSLQNLASLSITADQRPARFLRLVKPVGIPDRDDTELTNPPDLRNTAYGRNANLGMREILGYAMIDPDGSVKVKVPANVAFGVEVLDKFGRRIGPRHDNWLQVRPGDTLNCVGCHEVPGGTNPPLPLPHGRSDAVAASINAGASTDSYSIPGSEIPGTSVPYLANYGETMAETRTRTDPRQLNPGMNIEFVDYWTPVASPTHDVSFSYLYSDITALTVLPVSSTCNTTWSAGCRAVINYREHIEPLWEVSRGAGGADTCIACHTTNNGTQVPAGQLDLTDGVSDENADHVESYRDLLFDDNEQTLVNGAVTDVLITQPAFDDAGQPILDANGNQVFEQVPVSTPRSMSESGARASYFMEKLTETEITGNARTLLPATVNHSAFMSVAELRLIAEWLDLGAQYFNNPFDPAVPMN